MQTYAPIESIDISLIRQRVVLYKIQNKTELCQSRQIHYNKMQQLKLNIKNLFVSCVF